MDADQTPRNESRTRKQWAVTAAGIATGLLLVVPLVNLVQPRPTAGPAVNGTLSRSATPPAPSATSTVAPILTSTTPATATTTVVTTAPSAADSPSSTAARSSGTEQSRTAESGSTSTTSSRRSRTTETTTQATETSTSTTTTETSKAEPTASEDVATSSTSTRDTESQSTTTASTSREPVVTRTTQATLDGQAVVSSLPRGSYVAVFQWLPKSRYSAAEAARYAADRSKDSYQVVAVDGDILDKAGAYGIGVAGLDSFSEATRTCVAMGFGGSGKDCFRRPVLG